MLFLVLPYIDANNFFSHQTLLGITNVVIRFWWFSFFGGGGFYLTENQDYNICSSFISHAPLNKQVHSFVCSVIFLFGHFVWAPYRETLLIFLSFLVCLFVCATYFVDNPKTLTIFSGLLTETVMAKKNQNYLHIILMKQWAGINQMG